MNNEVVSYKQNQEMQGLYVVFQYIDNFGGHYYKNGKKEYPYKEIAFFVGNIPEESRGLFTEIISEKLCSLLYKEIYFPPAYENADAYFIQLLKYDELDDRQRYDAAVNRNDRALVSLVSNIKKNLATVAAMQVEAESSFNNCEIIDLSDEMTPQFDDAAIADITPTTDGLLGIVDRFDAIAQNSAKQTELLEMIYEGNKTNYTEMNVMQNGSTQENDPKSIKRIPTKKINVKGGRPDQKTTDRICFAIIHLFLSTQKSKTINNTKTLKDAADKINRHLKEMGSNITINVRRLDGDKIPGRLLRYLLKNVTGRHFFGYNDDKYERDRNMVAEYKIKFTTAFVEDEQSENRLIKLM